MKRARVRPVVTAFQDLCLGAPLSDVLLWETQQKKRKKQNGGGTGWNSKSDGSRCQKVTSLCCQ